MTLRLLPVAALALALGVITATSRAAVDASARLRITHVAPLVVRGTGFNASERVRLVVRLNGVPRKRMLRASAGGAFVASFATPSYDPCRDDIAVVATGSRHKAAAKLPQRECPIG